MNLEDKKSLAVGWFKQLRDDICAAFESLELHADTDLYGDKVGSFERKVWQRPSENEVGGGGGEMSLMRGRLFEKVGVNISTVHGEFSEVFRKEIPNAQQDPRFWAAGISLVAHMQNPHVPAIHMNTRFIVVGDGTKCWFGGGTDLNPMLPNPAIEQFFHDSLKQCCNAHGADYYDKYKQWCDEYFFIKHRGEPRGAGGIFYDYLSDNWDTDFAFTQYVGRTFLQTYPEIVRRTINQPWNEAERSHQLFKRGRYAEFNLVYDRGTRFGLMTGGNAEAILMSLPPIATW